MIYTVKFTSRYKRDYKACIKRGWDISLLDSVVELLMQGKPLPARCYDHELVGNWKGFRECHIRPDWLLLYYVDHDIVTLTLTQTGTHSDLFQK